MARRSPPRNVTYFEPVPPRLARNTVIESTFDAANPFSRGLAIIWMGKREGIIDRTGNITWVSLD